MAGQPTDYVSPLMQGPRLDGSQFLQGTQAGNNLLQARSMGMEQQAFQQQQMIKQQALQAAQQQAVEAAKKEMAFQTELDAAAAARDPGAIAALIAKNPDKAEKLKIGYQALSDEQRKETVALNSVVESALRNDAVDVAIAEVKRRADAIRTTQPAQAAKLDEMAKRILWQPEKEYARVAGILAAVEPEKYAQNAAKVASIGADVDAATGDAKKKLAEAEIAGAEADIADDLAGAKRDKTRAEAARLYAQTKNEAERLGFDREKFALEYEAARAKAEREGGDLPAPIAGKRDEAVMASTSAGTSSRAATELAGKFRDKNWAQRFFGTGIAGKLSEVVGDTFGLPDEVNAIKKQYKGLVNSEVLKNLPPGAASDTDVKLMREAFDSPNASFEQIAKGLDAMARTQDRIRAVKDLEAGWFAKNRGLGEAKADGEVGGIPVKKGQTFAQGLSALVKKQEQAEKDAANPVVAEATALGLTAVP